jgi:4-amino-4-deoxy-L-arabinose transferase-like glycosyltransferase
MKFSHNSPQIFGATSLSRKKINVESAPARPVAEAVELPIPRTPNPWESRLEPFLARYALPLVLLFIAIAIARIVSTYNVLSTTADEPAHIACGLEYLTRHTYLYETQHPPLTRAMIALLPYLSGSRTQGVPGFQYEGWAIITYQHHPDRTVFLMRLGNLPFFILGCFVVFFWARRYFGPAVGVVATALFTLIPTVLAHAGLATTDMGLAACLGAAFLAMLVWLEQPTPWRGVVFGLCTALALLSKFTAIGFLPVAAAVAFAFYLAAERPAMANLTQLAKERAASFGIAVAVCLFTIWATYFFSIGKVPFWNVTLPAWEYFDGIRVAMMHNSGGHPAYLLGEPRTFGWWYYFPVGLAVKSPIAYLLLLFIGLWACWKNRARLPWLLPVALAIGILLPAMSGNVNIGVRHVLPVYLAFSIIAALGFVHLVRRAGAAQWTAGALVLWLAVTGAAHHPNYIPYFNELVPYPQDRVLCDSDYDWGQDLKRLAARLRQLGATQVNYGYLVQTDSQFLRDYVGMPPITPIHPLKPAEGWTAICPTFDHATQYGLEYRYPDLRPWYTYLPVKERVGTIDLIYLAPGSLADKK